jgi:hypothetical protein
LFLLSLFFLPTFLSLNLSCFMPLVLSLFPHYFVSSSPLPSFWFNLLTTFQVVACCRAQLILLRPSTSDMANGSTSYDMCS